MAKEAARYIPKMKAEGCDFIAVVFHSGLGEADGELTFSVNTENQVRRVIAKNEGIDIVVAGHDHYPAIPATTIRIRTARTCWSSTAAAES